MDDTFLVALAGGAVGTLLTLVVAFAARLAAIPGDVRANDRALAEYDEDLESWVADEHVRLRRELRKIRSELAARGAFHSGDHGHQVALAKERALHAYRDQERLTLRDAQIVRDREGRMHRAWRFLSFRHPLELHAPARVVPVLDVWRLPATRHLQPTDTPSPVNDPTMRTLDATLAEVAGDTSDMQ